MHWRRFKVATIPLERLEDFHTWLMERWNEKEVLLEEHAKTGRFPSSINPISTEVKLGRWWEMFQLCAVLAPLIAGLFGLSKIITYLRSELPTIKAFFFWCQKHTFMNGKNKAAFTRSNQHVAYKVYMLCKRAVHFFIYHLSQIL